MTDVTARVITWRPSFPVRVAEGFLGGVIGMACVVGVVLAPGAWYLYPLLAAAVVVLSDLRRKSVLDDRRLRIRGRFSSRVIDLSDVRQVGLSRVGWPWVQTRTPRRDGGDVTALRMVPVALSLGQGPVASEAVVGEIRRRAAAAGAELDDELRGRTRPPTRKPLVFGL